VATVFAGGAEAAVAHLRAKLSDYPPSSPSMALFQDGKPVYMLHRPTVNSNSNSTSELPLRIAVVRSVKRDHHNARGQVSLSSTRL
jgi:putative YphP/YqiW family bacilliredoxin